MSDSKKKPKIPPPDDFSKTTPNIDLTDEGDTPADWEKTGDFGPSDAPADDWGKTVINYNVSSDHEDTGTLDGTQEPSDSEAKEPDWGMTQRNINLGDDFESNSDEEFGEESVSGVTVPYFQLPEAEKAKYQVLPPTPTEKAKKAEEKRKREGGIPTWFWVSAGLMAMFAFAVVVLLGVYFFFMGESGFTVIVKGAQPGSKFWVDGTGPVGVTATGKSGNTVYALHGLTPGRNRTVIIRKKGYKDDVHPNIKGVDGEEVSIIAKQQKSEGEREGCEKIVDVKTREDCANRILDDLDTPPDLNDLLRALNLYYINFDSGEHGIPQAREKFLQRATTYIKQLPGTVVIEIGGHTDNVGSDSKNHGLSDRRANSVKDFFVKQGVNAAMLQTKGYGETQPKATNDTQVGRFENRRIAYRVIRR